MVDKVLGSLGLTSPKSPKVSTDSITSTEEEKKKAKTARASLLETSGGIAGQELQPGQVGRPSLFGN